MNLEVSTLLFFVSCPVLQQLNSVTRRNSKWWGNSTVWYCFLNSAGTDHSNLSQTEVEFLLHSRTFISTKNVQIDKYFIFSPVTPPLLPVLLSFDPKFVLEIEILVQKSKHFSSWSVELIRGKPYMKAINKSGQTCDTSASESMPFVH